MTIQFARRLFASSLFRIAATIILVGVIVWRSQPQALISKFGTFGVANILLALGLTIPFLWFKTLRWQLMLRNAGTDTSFREAGISLVGGMGLALITPARVGEIARVAYLRDRRKLRLSALVLLDKFFDVLVLVILAVAGAWVLLGWIPGVLFAVIAACGLAFTYRPQLFQSLIDALIARVPLGGKTSEVMSSLESLGPAETSSYIATSLAAFVIVIGQFAIILHGPQPNLGLQVAALVFPLVILTNVLPLTIAGLGIREGAAMLLLVPYHVPRATAADAAFLMFVVNTAVPGLIGALFPLFRISRSPVPAPVDPASTQPAP